MAIVRFPASSGGASTFLTLNDTPSSYSGQGGKGVRVNAGATALEFFVTSGGGDVSASANFGTDNLLIRSDGVLKGVQKSNIVIDDSDNMSAVNSITGKTSGLTIDTVTNGDITITPHGSGQLNLSGGSGVVDITTTSGNANINITPHNTGVTAIKNPQISNLTENELVVTDGSKNLQSLAVATYPNLTELSYVKGVTSVIQTQIDAKQATLSGASLTSVTVATDDKVLIQDTSDSNNLKTVTAQSIADLASGGGSESLASHTASTVSNDAITYGFGKTNYIDGDAAIDFSAKIDESTMVDGGTMEVIFKANGADRTVSYATIFTTKLGTSMTVSSGDVAHYRIKKVGSAYYLYLNGIT